jgi:hypothetical protein
MTKVITRGAVIIGVNKAGDLPVLRAAVSGAKDFARWAEVQGFAVELLTDDDNKSVTIWTVRSSLAEVRC